MFWNKQKLYTKDFCLYNGERRQDMRKYNGWTGAKGEIDLVLEATLLDLDVGYPDLTQNEVNALFCSVLSSEIVQNVIHEQMALRYEQGEDRSVS